MEPIAVRTVRLLGSVSVDDIRKAAATLVDLRRGDELIFRLRYRDGDAFEIGQRSLLPYRNVRIRAGGGELVTPLERYRVLEVCDATCEGEEGEDANWDDKIVGAVIAYANDLQLELETQLRQAGEDTKTLGEPQTSRKVLPLRDH